MGNPRITVVTVCYNNCKALEQTIQNVLSQDYDNLEYIIVDGGSNDGSLDVIRKYDSRLSKWISEPDQGVYYAMNKGIDYATGTWVNFMNAGDFFVDNHVLASVFSYHLYPLSVGMIYGDTVASLPFGKFFIPGKRTDGGLHFCHQSVFCRADLLKKIKFDTRYRILADQVLLDRIKAERFELQYVNKAISVYEGYNGLSARNAVSFYKEVTMKEGKPFNLRWKLSVCKLKLKLFLTSLFSEKKQLEKYEKEVRALYKEWVD